MTGGHLLLVDASGFAYRAFHSANPLYREDGQPIGAVLAFMGMVWRMLGAAEADKPTHGAAVFDFPGKNFRHELFPAYKANRAPARSLELKDQFPFMRHAAETLGLHVVEAKGFEADDVLATLAVRATKAGMRTTIVSSDKDMGQLVIDGKVEIMDPLQKRRMLEADIVQKMGVPPPLVPHLQALWGDAVDGIPGVDGIGRQRAAALVRRFGDVESVLAHVEDIRWPQIKRLLKDRKVAAQIRLNLQLTTLRQNVRLRVTPAELTLEPIMRTHLVEILRVLEASHHMEAIFALDPQMTRVVPHVGDSECWWREEMVARGQAVPELPQAGYYQRKMVKGGPFVPARIWREVETDGIPPRPTGMDILRCEVGEKARDPFAEWVRLSMSPIARTEFDFLKAKSAHAKKWDPTAPAANPSKPIDITQHPVSRNPRPLRKKP